MDSAQDSLPIISETTEESHDGPGALRIESRSGFVQKEEKLGLRSKLNSNSRPLPLLDTERPNHSIRHRV